MQTIGITIGLCNNMFQFALGKSLESYGHKVQYKFFNSPNSHTGPNSTDNHSLSPYGIILPTESSPAQHNFNEQTFAYDPNVYKQRNETLFLGNWQSEKYFIDIEDEIRDALRLKDPLRVVEDLALRLRNSQSCFIHIRRGDYTLPRNIEYHGDAGGLEYYNAAIEYVRKHVPEVAFFVFSDDPQWCEENFPQFKCVSSQGFSKYEDLYLMSQCKHAIIANSSFSWWSAWLGNCEIVVAPKQWFRGANLDTSTLIPEKWVTL